MCLGSAKSTSRYDDEHVMGPRPVRWKARASKRRISWHETGHGTLFKKSIPRPKYAYGPKGYIVGDQLTNSLCGESDARGSAPGRSRYDDEHIIHFPLSPAEFGAPVELEDSHSYGMASSVSHYDDEHIIDAGRPVKGQRDPYIYGSRGQIMGRREDERHGESGPINQAELKASLLAADLKMKKNDKHYLIRRDENLRGYIKFPEDKEMEVQCAKSSLRYEDEHVIGSSSSGLGISRHVAKDGKVEPMFSVDPALKGDDDRIMQAKPQHKTRMYESVRTHGMAKSVSKYDDEHAIGAKPSGRGKGKGLAKEEDVIALNSSVDLTSKHDDEHFVSSKNVGGTSSGADAVLAMFSGESIHGGRADERRIGEKLDGRKYGPGSYLSGKAPSNPKREAERKSMSKRPKEYGF